MLSRTADSLYWMNRYMERADGLLRTVRTGFIASYDVNKEEPFSWESILTIFSKESEESCKLLQYKANDVLHLLLENMNDYNSLKMMITRARENARGAQDHLTKEVWEAVNQMYHNVNNLDLSNTINNGDQITMLTKLSDDCLAYYGVTDITMPRSQGWNFMNLGRYTERCFQTLAIVGEKFKEMEYDLNDAQHIVHWRNMLLCLSGYELYLKTYRSGSHTENIIDMTFFNHEFPRSIIYSVNRVRHYLKNVLAENEHSNNEHILRVMGKFHATIAYSDLQHIQKTGLKIFISTLKKQLLEINQLIGQSFFSYY